MNTDICLPLVNYTPTDANAFKVLADFSRATRAAGWTKQQLDDVIAECMSSNYQHLISTVFKRCMI
jgi:hypothetical protein